MSRALHRYLKCGSRAGGVAMARISDMHKRWMKEPKYRKAYDSLEEEFVLTSTVIDAVTAPA